MVGLSVGLGIGVGIGIDIGIGVARHGYQGHRSSRGSLPSCQFHSDKAHRTEQVGIVFSRRELAVQQSSRSIPWWRTDHQNSGKILIQISKGRTGCSGTSVDLGFEMFFSNDSGGRNAQSDAVCIVAPEYQSLGIGMVVVCVWCTHGSEGDSSNVPVSIS